MWDLRFATAPMRVLEHHTRGVLSVAWCQQDSDLLLSAAKDNQVLCWNPNTDQPGGEVSQLCAIRGLYSALLDTTVYYDSKFSFMS